MKTRTTAFLALTVASFVILLGLVAGACGPKQDASSGAEEARYQKLTESLTALAAKEERFRADIERSKMEFDAELQRISSGSGADKSAALGALNARVETFLKDMEQKAMQPAQPAEGMPPAPDASAPAAGGAEGTGAPAGGEPAAGGEAAPASPDAGAAGSGEAPAEGGEAAPAPTAAPQL
ncbi:MAG: hypothetical protein HYV63_02260 [Candidatus Schekmanbacteria bacterium]|nr:hypothetical protein [Candidatus Schekmanbacteria bacterium]